MKHLIVLLFIEKKYIVLYMKKKKQMMKIKIKIKIKKKKKKMKMNLKDYKEIKKFNGLNNFI